MYATLSDMRARYSDEELIQLTDQAQQGVIDQARVTAALGDASDEIDSYLKAVYTLPLASVPPMLKRHCLAMARYLLYREARPDPVQNDRDDALDWLAKISRGLVKLDAGGSEPVAAPATVSTTCDTAVSSLRDSMRGF